MASAYNICLSEMIANFTYHNTGVNSKPSAVNMKSLSINEMSKKLHDMNPEITFRRFGIQLLFREIHEDPWNTQVFELRRAAPGFRLIWNSTWERGGKRPGTDIQNHKKTVKNRQARTRERMSAQSRKPPSTEKSTSTVNSNLVSKFINPSPDTGIDSILNPNAAVSVIPFSATIIPQTPIPIIQPQQQTHDSTTTITTTIPTTTVLEIPNFASLFGFERRVSSLESDLSELKQTNQFAKVLSSIPGIVDKYLTTKVKDTVDVVVQLKSDKLREEAQAKNQDFLNLLDSNSSSRTTTQITCEQDRGLGDGSAVLYAGFGILMVRSTMEQFQFKKPTNVVRSRKFCAIWAVTQQTFSECYGFSMGFLELWHGRGDAGDFGYFWDVGFSKGYIGGSGYWHFVT
ncbi:hypothetical protein Tco_1385246 [Tanacetum coccineum]